MATKRKGGGGEGVPMLKGGYKKVLGSFLRF